VEKQVATNKVPVVLTIKIKKYNNKSFRIGFKIVNLVAATLNGRLRKTKQKKFGKWQM